MHSARRTVTSKDGTPIGYQCEGAGPAVVLVGGSLDDGAENAVLLPALASEFTVYNYARRGRADSGDTQPYAVFRELEDDAAVLGEDGTPPTDRLATIGHETLVLDRSTSDPFMSALPVGFFAAAATAVATALPRATSRTIDAPGHAVDAAAVAPAVRNFLVR